MSTSLTRTGETWAPLPSKEEVIELLRLARGGNEDAYVRLKAAFHKPLVGLIRLVTEYREPEADEVAEDIWEKNRQEILRAPEDGGFSVDRKGAFHSFVFNDCTTWGKSFREAKKKWWEEPWPKTQTGDDVEIAEPKSGAPDILKLSREAFTLLFWILFHPETGYPHQQFALALSKYFGGAASPRGMEGSPVEVDQEHGSASFWDLRSLMERAVRRGPWDDDNHGAQPANCLAGLRQRLLLRVSELMGRALEYKTIADKCVGDTTLRLYYGSRPAESAIPDWCNKVKCNIRAFLRLPRGASDREFLDQVGRRFGKESLPTTNNPGEKS